MGALVQQLGEVGPKRFRLLTNFRSTPRSHCDRSETPVGTEFTGGSVQLAKAESTSK